MSRSRSSLLLLIRRPSNAATALRGPNLTLIFGGLDSLLSGIGFEAPLNLNAS